MYNEHNLEYLINNNAHNVAIHIEEQIKNLCEKYIHTISVSFQESLITRYSTIKHQTQSHVV